jgi:hypothetical protein
VPGSLKSSGFNSRLGASISLDLYLVLGSKISVFDRSYKLEMGRSRIFPKFHPRDLIKPRIVLLCSEIEQFPGGRRSAVEGNREIVLGIASFGGVLGSKKKYISRPTSVHILGVQKRRQQT